VRDTYGLVANHFEPLGRVASLAGVCRSSYGIDATRQMIIIDK
jgi:hypothetical protein